MKKLLLLKYQEHYDKMLAWWINEDYERIIRYCKKNNIAISDEMLPENGGYEAFVDVAEKDENYQLGYVPRIKKGYKLLSRETFAFEDGKWVRRKYYKGGKKYVFRGCENPKAIKAFGIELSLRGWCRFTGMTRSTMEYIVNRGMRIEDYYHPRGSSICKDGKTVNLRELCYSEGVSYGSFRNRMSRFRRENGLKRFDQIPESVYLNELKQMKSSTKGTSAKDHLENGYLRQYTRQWLLVDDCDFADIIKVMNGSGETVPQIIHRLISIAKQNKAKGKTENTQQEKQ